MSDDDSDSEEAGDAQQSQTTFKVTATRQFEVDFPSDRVREAMVQTDAQTPEEAVELLLKQDEQKYIKPREKLLGLNVHAEEQ